MALTSINVRSPWIVDITGVARDTTKVELFIWNDPDSLPGTPTYTLEKPIPSSIITKATYDISPYCRNYINHTSFTAITSDTAAAVEEYCFCTVVEYLNGIAQVSSSLICFDGFGYHSEEMNPTLGNTFLTDGDYQVNSEGGCGAVYYHDNQSVTWEARWTGLQSGGITTITLANEVGFVPYVNNNYLGEGNKLEIIQNSVIKNTYNFREVEECKYDPINCDFVNRYGVWQRIVFFKVSSSNLEMSNTEYNLMPQSTDYDPLDNVRQVFNVNAKETIKCNTGWVYESYSDVIKQLQLSEKIMLDNVPVIIKSKGVKLQKSINDKNINYEVAFSYSAPTLQYNT